MRTAFDVDYLVVGAGLAGMAIADELLAHTDASIALVDRRAAPGGHWHDAYPFVRLHQPSTFYGVGSVPLGRDTVQRAGLDTGFYEQAGPAELCAYFARVMDEVFLPTGRVRWLPCADYLGEEDGTHRVDSRLADTTHAVRVRRRLVDATYLEGRIPATSPPPFAIDDGVRWCTPGQLPRLPERPACYAVIGAGKTALDTCVWLLGQGVPPASIRWVKPREGWWLNRRFHQPLAMLPQFQAGVVLQLQAFAQAQSLGEALLRLEEEGFLLRVDRAVEPTMLHGAIASEPEVTLLRGIEDVVRLGRVRRIERDRIVLDGGEVPTGAGTLHVHCAAPGLAAPPLRPIFSPGRITVQPTVWGFASFQFAMLGAAEALLATDEERNGVCPPIRYWDRCEDFAAAYLALLASERARAAHPALAGWAKACRLNPLGRIGEHRDDPRVAAARDSIRHVAGPAVANLARFAAAGRL